MGIITLTTDMGTRDHYVASIKGRLLSSHPTVSIVDVSHDIRPFDVSQAAYELRSCIGDFPDNTVHIIGVDSEPVINFGQDDGAFPSILEFNNQYIISNDNGFFGAFLDEEKDYKLWRVEDVLSNPKAFKFPSKNIFVPVANKILNNEDLESFCSPVERFKLALKHVATTEPNLIKGHVINIDNYGNAITNISKDIFYQYGENTPFTIFFRGKKYYIDVISNTYNEERPGEKVALFNENNLLEIAINRGATKGAGGAKQLLGIQIGEIIRIEFTPKGSRTTIESLFQ